MPKGVPHDPERARRRRRDTRIVKAYRAGASLRELAGRFGLSVSGVHAVLARRDALLTPAEAHARIVAANRQRAKCEAWRRRHRAGCRQVWRDPAYRARQAAGVRRGRSAWPDCPADLLDDYRMLQAQGFRAAEARAMLERGSLF